VGRVGPKFLCREPNNMTLGKEINLIKLIIKNSKLREIFPNFDISMVIMYITYEKSFFGQTQI
jgi:hypothetical protein